MPETTEEDLNPDTEAAFDALRLDRIQRGVIREMLDEQWRDGMREAAAVVAYSAEQGLGLESAQRAILREVETR